MHNHDSMVSHVVVVPRAYISPIVHARPPLRPKLHLCSATPTSSREHYQNSHRQKFARSSTHATPTARNQPYDPTQATNQTSRERRNRSDSACLSSAWAGARKSHRSRKSHRQRLRLIWFQTCTVGESFSYPINSYTRLQSPRSRDPSIPSLFVTFPTPSALGLNAPSPLPLTPQLFPCYYTLPISSTP